MNKFLILAELIHFLSFVLLYYKIKKTRSCLGISYKTQEIYLLVFLTRFCDLNIHFEIIDYVLRIFYLTFTALLIYTIRFQKPFSLTYQKEQDYSQFYNYIYPTAIVLTLIFHTGTSLTQICQSFSIWLEALAILPQMNLMQKIQDVENLAGYYVLCLGVYRGLYVISWYCRVFHAGWWCSTTIFGGTLAVIIYSDFVYLFFKNKGAFKVFV
ncbi:unnamed protein product [Paramecium sonneborni]|uniref:ER lumen protein-retaining receptor n=1 Tax=Paramecium sonneborni TaxID=65129 RepID=A0A8S1K5S5_9CILI|nr:unnamed protein product [Paramecium sonneborni]